MPFTFCGSLPAFTNTRSIKCEVYSANHAPKTTHMQVLSPNTRFVADPYNRFPPLAFAELLEVDVPTLTVAVTLAVAPPEPVGT